MDDITSIKAFITTIVMLAFSCAQVKAQAVPNVDSAYRGFDRPSMEKIIWSHTYKNNVIANDTAKNLNQLFNAFLTDYTNQTRHTLKAKDFPQLPGSEKYILLQPEISVGFVSDLKHVESSKPYIEGQEPEEKLFGNPAGPAGDFVSQGFYKFPELKNCRLWEYNVDTSNKEKYVPIRIDTAFSNELILMLKGIRGQEHYERRTFLSYFFNLYRTGIVETLQYKTSNPIVFSAHNFYINKIVFNKSMTSAEIQFSFPRNSMEANYHKVNGRWIKSNENKILIYCD
jgi:hypothetical protein